MKIDEGISIVTDPGVYEPAEDSFLMIEALEIRPGEDVLEVGCGTGIIALHCSKAGGLVTASDASPKAVECARANAKRNGLNVNFVESDLFGGISGKFEVIIFNPPYLPADQPNDTSWTGGESGLEITISFLQQSADHLSPGGRIYAIVSTASDAKKFDLAVDELGYSHEIVARKKLFFEELTVHRLRRLTFE